MNLNINLHPDLADTINCMYKPCGYDYSTPTAEAESQEYAAYRFAVNDQQVVFRTAKNTPTKVGLFVTIWKRGTSGVTQPFDAADTIDLVIIYVRHNEHKGQFVFPKLVLIKQGVMSNRNKGGKRGMRVYPPWDTNLNRQATKTQAWQLPYFLDMTDEVDAKRVTKFYNKS